MLIGLSGGGCAVQSNLNSSYLAAPRCAYAGAAHCLDLRHVVVVIWSRSINSTIDISLWLSSYTGEMSTQWTNQT